MHPGMAKSACEPRHNFRQNINSCFAATNLNAGRDPVPVVCRSNTSSRTRNFQHPKSSASFADKGSMVLLSIAARDCGNGIRSAGDERTDFLKCVDSALRLRGNENARGAGIDGGDNRRLVSRRKARATPCSNSSRLPFGLRQLLSVGWRSEKMYVCDVARSAQPVAKLITG